MNIVRDEYRFKSFFFNLGGLCFRDTPWDCAQSTKLWYTHWSQVTVAVSIVRLSQDPNPEWHASSWLTTDSQKSWTILNIRATRANCGLFPEFRAREQLQDLVCRTEWMLKTCIYFIKKSTTIMTITYNPTIYLFFSRHSWLTRGWLGLALGSSNATARTILTKKKSNAVEFSLSQLWDRAGLDTSFVTTSTRNQSYA